MAVRLISASLAQKRLNPTFRHDVDMIADYVAETQFMKNVFSSRYTDS